MIGQNNNFFTIESMCCFTYYEGLNHRIDFFSPADQFVTRQGFHVLKNPMAQPFGSLNPQGPLSVRSSVAGNQALLSLPEGCFANIETPEHHGASSLVDICIVSRLYTGYVLGSMNRFHPDYLDRLFHVVKLYRTDPKHDPDAKTKIIGVAGLIKVTNPLTPSIYVQRLPECMPLAPENQVPSLAAMALSVQLFPSDPNAGRLAQCISNRLQQRRK